jgi:hypothetical protein
MSALHQDGIYFNLPEEAYLAEDRLSKSGIKRMRVSPADYWVESSLNPNPPELTPEQERARFMARVIGRAYHCARLEPERYAATYVRELSKADLPEGTLFTGSDMKAWLAENGLKQTGTVAEQAARIAEADPSVSLWHIAEEAFRSSVKPGQVVIPAKAFEEIAVDMERIRAVPAVRELLSGGAAEVSVFWTCLETGIRMKARFDYLKADRWVEFKTFANSSRKALFQALTDAIRFERYHIDAAAYMEAAEAIRTGGLEVVGDPSLADAKLIMAIRQRPEPLGCNFVFQQKGGVPNILERSFRFFEPTPSEEAIRELERNGASEEHLERAKRFREVAGGKRHATAIHTKGRMEIKAAKRDWLAYSEIYERGEPWLPFNPSGEITDEDFSSYFLEETI